jgi:hypothetical protein
MFGQNPISSAPFTSLTTSIRSQLLSVTVTAAVSIAKAVRKTLSISSTATVSLIKAIYKILSILSTATVSLSALRVKILTVLSTSSVTIVKAISKIFSTIVDNVLVVLTESAFHLISFALTVTGTPSLIKKVGKFMTINSTAIVSLLKSIPRTFSIAVTGTVSIIKSFFKTISNSVTATVSLARHLIFGRVLSVAVTGTVSLKKLANKLLFVTSYVIITMTKGLQRLFTISVTGFTSLLGQVSPIFGAISSNVYYAIQRIRSIDLVKIRSIFLDKNNGK